MMEMLPDPEVYELEMRYAPWGRLMQEVTDFIVNQVPSNGSVVDLLCGPGHLLHSIRSRRPDISLTGVDIDARYVEFAAMRDQNIRYVCTDARSWTSDERFDIVVCTGSLHHLPYENQPGLLAKMAGLMKDGGSCVCADPCLSGYKGELGRQLAALELGSEYLRAVIEKGAPPFIVSAFVDVLRNDVLADGEYKNSFAKLMEMTQATFPSVQAKKVWPARETEYGDYWLLLSR